MADNAELTVSALPTKEFFVEMLVKDIDLIDAIVELVDNSVDGARELRSTFDFKGLWVRLEMDTERFAIKDNCGGIPLEVAQRYAFRFGRPNQENLPIGSIGRFGVGMKRALFKIGKKFTITSHTTRSSFRLSVDVEEWVKDKDWEFHLDEASSIATENEVGQSGTSIEVNNLLLNISEQFGKDSFSKHLGLALASKHAMILQHGVAITLNGIPIDFKPFEILESDEIQPAFVEEHYEMPEGTVHTKFYVGLGRSDPKKAGWYVFCNGRLILEAEREQRTGWGDGIPIYHNQFARFRGYVFFDADNPRALPWKTTKADVDTGADVYRRARDEMKNLMRPVIDFLNQAENEKRQWESDDPTPLEQKMSDAKTVAITQLALKSRFEGPRILQGGTQQINVARISYERPRQEVETVKRLMGASTYKEVGEKTFEYFYNRECED